MLKLLNELRPDSIVNTVGQCSIYNVHCILYNIHCKYTLQYTLCTILTTVHMLSYPYMDNKESGIFCKLYTAYYIV